MNMFAVLGKMRGVVLMAGMALCLASCGILDSVYVRDQALDSAIRAALGQPFGPLSKSSLRSIKEIQAANLNIRDLEGIQYCESLTVLNLRNNQIASITPLNSCRNIVRLDLGENRITNIEPIAGMLFLEELVIYGNLNEVIDWQPLAANCLAGGVGPGNTVLLPNKSTMDSEGNPLPNFASTREVLLNNGVIVITADPGTTTQ